jgi:hypothetical protein
MMKNFVLAAAVLALSPATAREDAGEAAELLSSALGPVRISYTS